MELEARGPWVRGLTPIILGYAIQGSAQQETFIRMLGCDWLML